MNQSKDKTVLFRVSVSKQNGGFSHASNFITKLTSREELLPEDVKGISNKFILADTKGIEKVRHLIANEGFHQITKPHNMLDGITGVRYEFGLVIEDEYLQDVVSIQPYVLMKRYFREVGLFAVILGSKPHFFPMSYYLSDVLSDSIVAGSLFYHQRENNSLQAMKVIRRGGLAAFYPIQIVDQEMLHFLSGNLKEMWPKNGGSDFKCIVNDILQGNEKVYLKAPEQFQDLCYALQREKKHFAGLDGSGLPEILERGTVLTFVLFVFSLGSRWGKDEESTVFTDYDEVKTYYRKAEDYAAGILQLLENIVFHAQSRSGVFSMRLYNANSDEYLQRRFPGEKEASYLEVLIADYMGTNHCDNIATDFVNHLEPHEREYFEELTPRDLFAYGSANEDVKPEVDKAFRKYYENLDNIGKHYGLKMFRNMILKNKGAFRFYSCRSHTVQAGERGIWAAEGEQDQLESFPGTGYDILLPVIDYKRKTLSAGIENRNEFTEFSGHMKEFYVHPAYVCFPEPSYDSQKQKEGVVENYCTSMQGAFADSLTGRRTVEYVNVENCNGIQAELIYKALMKLALRTKMPDIVLYNSGEEFIQKIKDNAAVFFNKIGSEDIFVKNPFCIAVYSSEGEEEAVIYPGSLGETVRINAVAGYGHKRDWLEDLNREESHVGNGFRNFRVPYDVLCPVPIEDGEKTIFEQYVQTILNKDIQKEEYGCKLVNTHMRLGSTIHVSTFYEAELLFHNRYFVARFAMMIAWWLYREYREELSSRLTICAYGMYSESLVSQLTEILGNMDVCMDKDKIDYAILEKEGQDGSWVHSDKLRYSTTRSERESADYLQDRKYISIVPINSTLKTHEKLLEIFCRENNITDKGKFICNFSLILVGEEEGNAYWRLEKQERRCHPAAGMTVVEPSPIYFVHLPIPYFEASKCALCFPKNPLKELPLIEVNAYSTVPNQAIGLIREPWKQFSHEEYQKHFRTQNDYLSRLAGSLVYTHIRRNNNHFLYYFRTEKLFLEKKEHIRKWLEGISEKLEEEGCFSINQYHILFCPAHFSNAGFLEYVSKYVFRGATMIIRVDVGKEYRGNLRTKYSNLRILMKELGANPGTEYTVSAHFVDDTIITGRTYNRMLSLAQSILGDFAQEYSNIKMRLFDRIFVLVDRNSDKSKRQYLAGPELDAEKKLENRYFVYVDLEIPSIRSHGESCIICQLEQESFVLSRTSSTRSMTAYWQKRKKFFRPVTIKEYEAFEEGKEGEEGEEIKRKMTPQHQEKIYRRMYCYHTASILLGEATHGNQAERVMRGLLLLLTESVEYYQADSNMAFEYFLSYLKIISRPFLAYHKAIKEAVFQLLLILSEWMLDGTREGSLEETVGRLEKDGIETEKWIMLIPSFEKAVMPLLAKEENKRDFLLVCMKQLMELKSNYFIRKENMKRLRCYIQDWKPDNRNDVYHRYLIYVKKLIGVSSDTSKSIWLNEEIRGILDSGDAGEYLPADILQQLLLENIRAYYDGVERLSKDIKVQRKEDIDERLLSLRYRDFKNFIDTDGAYAVEKEAIWHGVEMFRYLRERFSEYGTESDKSREKYYDIANMACHILGAKKVYMFMATPLECELWRKTFREGTESLKQIYKDIAGQEPGEMPDVFGEFRKEYLIVSASDEDQTVMDVPIHVIKRIEVYEKKGCQEWLSEDGDFLIWELGAGRIHPIVAYAEFETKDRKRLLYGCKRLLMMNNLLNETAFNENAIHYLYDIVTAENDAIRLSFYKSFSHTPEDIRKQQYSDLVTAGKDEYFRSHIATLLSDLKVSETYRMSLKKDYYTGNLKLKCGKLFGERTFLGKVSDLYVVDGMTQSHVKVDIVWKSLLMLDAAPMIEGDELLSEEQEVAYKGYANGIDELILLIIALIENAASKGKTKEVDGEKKVQVYLSKTRKGRLRILNEVETRGDLEKICFFATRPPQPKDGISIWSMSRYLISLGCIVAQKLLSVCKSMEKAPDSPSILKENIVEYYQMVSKLSSGEFEVKVDYIEREERCFFSIELPVLAETYQYYWKS